MGDEAPFTGHHVPMVWRPSSFGGTTAIATVTPPTAGTTRIDSVGGAARTSG